VDDAGGATPTIHGMLKRLTIAVLSVVVLAGCGGDGDDGDDTAKDAGTPSSRSSGAPEGSAEPADVTCEYPADPPEMPVAREVEAPPQEPAVGGEVKVTMVTTLGDLEVTLDAAAAPCTVNSFVSLAEQGYYDDSPCHRLTTLDESGIAVLQCGDPTGEGTGGPGYNYADELTGAEAYGPGTLAMANRGANTNGSQFFIVYDDTPLPPSYTVFGSVADVQSVVELAEKGTVTLDTGTTAPTEDVDIEQFVWQ